MKLYYFVLSIAFVGVLATSSVAANVDNEKVEESTVSPLDKDVVDDVDSLKTSTERPPTHSMPAAAVIPANLNELPAVPLPDSPKHTVADFIIQPLIALKPRPIPDTTSGKQASTSSSPWSIFGFNPGQSIGSLAGSVSGWISDRIPSFVDTPVHAASTTTTPRPEVAAHPTRNPNRKLINRPDFYPNGEDDDDDYDDGEDYEYEDDDEVGGIVYPSNNRIRPNFSGPNGLGHNDEEDDDDDDDESYDDYEEQFNGFVPKFVHRPNNRLRPGQGQNQNVALKQQRRFFNLQRQQAFANKRRLQQVNQILEDENVDDDNEEDEDNLYYAGYRAMKRSQNNKGIIKRGQQNFKNKFNQVRKGQVPRNPQRPMNQRRTPPTPSPNRRNRRPAAAVGANKVGQKFKPQVVQPQRGGNKKRVQPNKFKQKKPQAQPSPTEAPVKQINQHAQYIAIPWSQLSIAPAPALQSFGLQAIGGNSDLKPIILNIPQSSINQIQQANQKRKTQKKPEQTTAEELFENTAEDDEEEQPLPAVGQIPMVNRRKPIRRVQPVRKQMSATKKPIIGAMEQMVVLQNKPATSSMINMPPAQRVRPLRPVAMLQTNSEESSDSDNEAANNTNADADADSDVDADADADANINEDTEESPNATVNLRTNRIPNIDREFIVIGDDDEPGFIRHVQPVYGSERLIRPIINPYFLQPHRQYKTGRELQEIVEAAANQEEIEQKIPVEIVYEEKLTQKEDTEDAQSIKSKQE